MDWLPLNQVSLTSNQLQQGAWSNPRVVSKPQMKWECSRKGTTRVYQNLLGNGTANKSWKGDKKPLKGTKTDTKGPGWRGEKWKKSWLGGLFYSTVLIGYFGVRCSVQYISVAYLCLTLCNPVDCSTRFRVHHQLLELSQTHVHQVSDAIQPSIIPFSSHLQSFPASGSFPMSQFFTSSSQSIGISASASVLPMNSHGWFPLGLTGLILLSKGLSRVFSNTTVQRHQFFSIQLSLFFF